MHSVYLGDREWLCSKEWLEKKETNKTMGMVPLWRELLRHAQSEFPEFWPKDRYKISIMPVTLKSGIAILLCPEYK